MAKEIRDVDPSMAMFRLFTAEEEAARAVIHSLHRLRYRNAGKLRWTRHDHKFALIPLVATIQRYAKSAVPGIEWLFQVDEDDGPYFTFRIPELPEGIGLRPHPPLDVKIDIGGGRVKDFQDDVRGMLEEDGVGPFEDWIRARAGQRNSVLYATDQGVPNMEEVSDENLQASHGNVFVLLSAYLLVDMHQHQALVQAALDGFLRLLDLLPQIDFDAPASD